MFPDKDHSQTAIESDASTRCAGVRRPAPESLPTLDSSPLIGTHRLLRVLGSGGMGVVYAAEDLQTGRDVALKVVAQRPECFLLDEVDSPTTRSRPKDRFVTEVQTTAQLDHPNIVTVFTAERSIGYAYYTMKLVDGVDLRRLIELMFAMHPRTRPWRMNEIHELLLTSDCEPKCSGAMTRSMIDSAPIGATDVTANPDSFALKEKPDSTSTQSDEQVVEGPAFVDEVFVFFASHMAEAAEAIAYANDEGVLHRDIKPSNLIVDRQGKLYVTDFGLAKWKRANGDDESTACVGTRGYIAPECLRSASAVDPRSEVFSLGCVLHKLMTLCPTGPPDPSDPSWETSAKRELPAGLFAIIRKAMAFQPCDRYESVGELASDLRRFAEGQPVQAATSVRRSTRTLRSSRHPRSLVLVTSAIVTLFCAGWGYRAFREMNRLATAERLQSQRANAMVDLLLDQLGESYRSAGEEALASNPKSPQPRRRLSEQAKFTLGRGVEVCQQILSQPGDLSTVHVVKVASLLRKTALIYQRGGEKQQAAEQYGLAASTLDSLDVATPEIIAERCWLHYLETRYLQSSTGYSAQDSNYEAILGEVDASLRENELDPKSQSRLHEVAGLVHIARQKYVAAIEHLMLVDQPEFGECSLRRTMLSAYRMGGQHQKALPMAKQLVADFPEDDEAWRELAGVRLHLDEMHEATSAFQRCVHLNPSNALGWQGLAWAHFRSGKKDQAIECIEDACRLAPHNDTVLMARAKFYMSDGRQADAVEDLRTALQLRPKSPYVVYPAITTLLFWDRSEPTDLRLCERVAQEYSDEWPRKLAREIKVLTRFRAGAYDEVIEIEAEDESRNPTLRLVTLAAKCLTGTKATRARALAELRQWQQAEWRGLDNSSANRLIREHVTRLCFDLGSAE
ncbi:MAG: protein kinase [Planctomycetota bacterium]